jgi:phospholipid/cholesterol/gamma-HCH transport system substrate-binding protein
MSKRTDQAKVGVMVLGTGAILIAAVFTMLHYNPFHVSSDTYRVYLEFAGGLENDSIVRFGGMRRGKVTGIALAAERPGMIRVDVRLDRGTPVRTGSVARLAALSALGENYIEISPGPQDSPLLRPTETIRSEETPAFSDLVVKINGMSEDAKKLIVDLDTNINRISQGADTLLGNLNDITGPTNRKALAGTLEGANTMVASANQLIASSSPKIDAIASNLQATTAKFDPLVDRLNEATARMKTLLENVDGTLAENRPQIRKDLESLEATLAEARKLMTEISDTLESNRGELSEMLENFRRSSENLTEFTDGIKERPFSLMRIKPKPDRKVPR